MGKKRSIAILFTTVMFSTTVSFVLGCHHEKRASNSPGFLPPLQPIVIPQSESLPGCYGLQSDTIFVAANRLVDNQGNPKYCTITLLNPSGTKAYVNPPVEYNVTEAYCIVGSGGVNVFKWNFTGSSPVLIPAYQGIAVYVPNNLTECQSGSPFTCRFYNNENYLNPSEGITCAGVVSDVGPSTLAELNS